MLNSGGHLWRYHVTAIMGFLVAVVPFLGFPGSWRQVMFAVLGVLLIGVSLTGSHRVRAKKNNPDLDLKKTEETTQPKNNEEGKTTPEVSAGLDLGAGEELEIENRSGLSEPDQDQNQDLEQAGRKDGKKKRSRKIKKSEN